MGRESLLRSLKEVERRRSKKVEGHQGKEDQVQDQEEDEEIGVVIQAIHRVD
jgi:hypothetical protein